MWIIYVVMNILAMFPSIHVQGLLLGSAFQLGVLFQPPSEYLETSRDIYSCHNCVCHGASTGILWIKDRDSTSCNEQDSLSTVKNYPTPNPQCQ